MALSIILFVLLGLTALPRGTSAACDGTSCTQSCVPTTSSCPSFDCGDLSTKKCNQYCVGTLTTCNTMTCSDKQESCEQNCLQCPTSTTMECSSKTCKQTCDGAVCNMKCTKDVESCEQTCSPNATCTMECHDGSQCQRSCGRGAKCTYPASRPPTPSPITTACVKSHCDKKCERPSCVRMILNCSESTTKTCGLLCKDGCTMYCGKHLDMCTMNCTGEVDNCKTTCKAKACYLYHNGKLIKKPTSATGTLIHMFGNIGIVLFEVILMYVISKL